MEYSCLLPTKRQERILVVDDSFDNIYLIQTILESEGYEIITASNGRAALEAVATLPPHLILLDVMMPEMDGYEVTRQLRQNRELSYIPILLITAHDRPKVAEGLDLGADDFIRKPVEYEELLARVRSLLRLKHSVDERDTIAREREDFVSRLTHDMRTPLIAADRMLTLIQDGRFGNLPLELLDVAGIMQRSNQNLLVMVNTLLEVYRHESGHKTLNLTQVDLPTLLQDVIQELAPLAAQKALILDFQQKPVDQGDNGNSEQLQVQGDALELRRVFMNLLSNAIKFTDQGSVQVRLHRAEALDLKKSPPTPVPSIKVEVQDTGPGIPGSEQPYLFQRFRQGQHKRDGSGLGLYLSARIMSLHGGQLQFQPIPTGGSLFIVTLPGKQ